MTAPDDAVPVRPGFAIPRRELLVRTSRAGGPGGQHVNTTATRVEVVWDIARSAVPTEAQRARLLTQLASRLDAAGCLRVVASDTRSQLQNRVLAETRLAETVARALAVPKVRRPTKPSRAAKARRVDDKKKAGEKKARRRWTGDE